MRAQRARAALAVVVLGLVVRVLAHAGRWLPSPPVRSWDHASQWYDLVGPDVAVIAIVRIGAVGVAIWLLGASLLQLLATVLRAPVLVSVADLVAPRSLQRLVHGLAGISLSAGLALPAPSAGILGDPSAGIAVLHLLDQPSEDDRTARMHLVPDPTAQDVSTRPPVDDAATESYAGSDAGSSAAVAEVGVAEVGVAEVDVVVVEVGDSLWSIAEDALGDAHAAAGLPAPGDAAVATYWCGLIEVNRAGLVDPSNPDLIYPGQIITLPVA